MSPAKLFTGVFGAVYLAVGLLGFLITGASQDSHQLLGLFDINAAHNAVHVLIGVTALAAFAYGESISRIYAGILAAVLAVVALAGFLPQPFLGILPIGGADVLLHGGTAVIGALVAVMAAPRVAASAAR